MQNRCDPVTVNRSRPQKTTGEYCREGEEGDDCKPGDLPECCYVPLRVKGLVAEQALLSIHLSAFFMKINPAFAHQSRIFILIKDYGKGEAILMKTDRKVDLKALHTPLFWDEVWEQSKEQFTPTGKKTLPQTVDSWNKRAERFIEKTGGVEGNQRVRRVTQWLVEQGVCLTGSSIIDIGAGPGAFSVHFAREAKQVVSLEPTEIMAQYLKKEVESRKLNNIKVVRNTWEEVDIEKEGYRGSFDLVFASMSPGLNSLETIEKALACSRKYLFISKHAGKRHSDLLAELWSLLYGEPLPSWRNEAIYILNMLYNCNYELVFKVWDDRFEHELSIAETVENLLEELKIFGKEIPTNQDKIFQYIEAKASKGLVINRGVTRNAKILVKK